MTFVYVKSSSLTPFGPVGTLIAIVKAHRWKPESVRTASNKVQVRVVTVDLRIFLCSPRLERICFGSVP